MGKVVMKFQDFAGQTSNFDVNIVDLDAANYAAQDALIDALVSAMADITAGNINTKTIQSEIEEIATGKSSNPIARRELKWLIRYADTVTGEIETREIPTPQVDDSDLFESDGETINLLDAEWVSFESAFEAVAKSNAGNAVTFLGGKLVGRNL